MPQQSGSGSQPRLQEGIPESSWCGLSFPRTDQELGSARQSSPVVLPSSLEGSEKQSEADLRRLRHSGVRERVCMGRGTIRLGPALPQP